MATSPMTFIRSSAPKGGYRPLHCSMDVESTTGSLLDQQHLLSVEPLSSSEEHDSNTDVENSCVIRKIRWFLNRSTTTTTSAFVMLAVILVLFMTIGCFEVRNSLSAARSSRLRSTSTSLVEGVSLKTSKDELEGLASLQSGFQNSADANTAAKVASLQLLPEMESSGVEQTTI
eukprot:TRINITY_DN42927_c0_g1_i1.p1 TRINITY_DN42927_c0_g1~~TRINITY_DN42927_c0_g1_i1.p1  ORF type:complete len:174 (-),score=27.26 TRINITY_DN42927_c0_g1_i1:532-1053(-)